MIRSLPALFLTLLLSGLLGACSDDNDNAAAQSSGPQLIGITDDLRIVTISPSTPAASSGGAAISGFVIDSPSTPPSPVAFDVRPSTGELYLLMSDDRLYTVNFSTGIATLKGRIGTSGLATMAFDPVADVIRVLTVSRGNLRVSPSNAAILGTDTNLAYISSDSNAGITPGVDAIAYLRTSSGATAFVIDATNDILARLGSVNGTPDSASSGRLSTLGNLSLPIGGGNSGFAILPGATAASTPTGYVIDTDATSTRLYTLNLSSGAMTLVGIVNGARFIGLALSNGIIPAGGGGGGPSLNTGIIAGEGSCTAALGGTGVTVSKNEGSATCLLCSITGEANLTDGDVNTPAVASFIAGLLLQPVSVTVTAPAGVVFPAGRVAGGTFAIPGIVPLSLGVIPDISISTQLGGVDTGESFPVARSFLNLSLLGFGLTPGEDRFFLGFTTTQSFDAVTLTLSPGVASVLVQTEIYAACANGTPGDELPAGLLPL